MPLYLSHSYPFANADKGPYTPDSEGNQPLSFLRASLCLTGANPLELCYEFFFSRGQVGR